MKTTKFQDAYQENILFMILDVWLCQKGWGEFAKATNGTASILQFTSTTFSSASVTTPMHSLGYCVKFKFTCKEKFS